VRDAYAAGGRRWRRITVLLRVPWGPVQRHMLERLRERGFDDLDAPTL
jgi:hypothetical protein